MQNPTGSTGWKALASSWDFTPLQDEEHRTEEHPVLAITGSTPGSQRASREKKRKGNLEIVEGGHLSGYLTAFSPQEPGGGTNAVGIHHTALVFSAMESSCGSGMGSRGLYTIPSYYSIWDCSPVMTTLLFRWIWFQTGVTYPKPKCCQPYWPTLPCLSSHKFQMYSGLANSSLRSHFSWNEANIREDISNNTLISCLVKLIPLQYLRY